VLDTVKQKGYTVSMMTEEEIGAEVMDFVVDRRHKMRDEISKAYFKFKRTGLKDETAKAEFEAAREAAIKKAHARIGKFIKKKYEPLSFTW